jgi:membrane-bound lytic murein transglycosylase D
MFRSCGALSAIGMIVVVMVGLAVAPQAAAEPFPRYEVITPNVDFWVKIYSHYPTTQVVIHDSVDLSIVYDVITVKPYDVPGARKINRRRTKRAMAKYRDLLKRLAANPQIDDKACQNVAKLFGTNADAKTYRRASQRVRSQLGQKDRFQAGLVRSGAYLDEIRTILKSNGVPEDLAYLPHVESSFNPSAYSKFGAAGIWQFTRSTGRRYMKVGYVLDERRDPIRATHAAAQLLKANYAKLGSWPLAITAYNHGAAGMARARQKHGDYPAIFRNYRSRTFKFASRNFYSEYLAARQVASDYKSYFGHLRLATPTPSHTVTLEGYAPLQDLCAHYDVAPETVRKMNPALRSPVFNDQKYVPKGYRLRLPPEAASGGAALAAVPASLYKSAQKPSRFYTVQRGDTAGRIARNHGVRLSDLILANNLSARATIYPRQTLRIPLRGEKVTPPKPQPAVVVAPEPPVLVAALDQEKPVNNPSPENTLSNQKALKPEPTTSEAPRKLPVAAPISASGKLPQPPTAPEPMLVEKQAPQVAQAPESAKRPAPELMEVPAPQASPEPAPQEKQAEDVRQIPEPMKSPKPASEVISEPQAKTASAPKEIKASPVAPAPALEQKQEAPIASSPVPEAKQEPPSVLTTVIPNPEIVSIDVRFDRVTVINQRPVGTVQVEVEETLGHYAEWAGIRAQQIRRLNGLRFGRTLHLHQKIKISLDKTTAAAFEEQRYEYHKRLQEDFFAVYRVSELEPYRVQQGDNYWMLSREKFDVPMWLLKHYNMDVDLAALRIQQKLMIPVIEQTTADDPGTVTNDEDPEAVATE